MKYLIVGGDERSVQLAQLMHSSGAEVLCCGLERAGLCEGIVHTDKPCASDCVILPVPVEDAEGFLKAPFAARREKTADILAALPSGSLVCGGRPSDALRGTAQARGIRLVDIMSRPGFLVGNAAITAEGAVSLLMEKLRQTIFDSRILIIGYGRIAKLLAAKLHALGAKVSVMSRSYQSLALAQALGLKAVPYGADAHIFRSFDAAVNTAPAPFCVSLEAFRRDCLLLELASAPGGFDASEAKRLGIPYVKAPGLPGSYAPISAAKIILDTVTDIVKEHNNDKA